MKRYSAFAVAREAMRHHTGWGRAWAKPTQPKKKYDAIIVGAGGHGLATAYYLGKNFGITNVAILEKGWLGGGNTGRNTTIIRSNYLQDPSAAIYEKSRSLYETMSQDLNYNVMFSPRGVIMLAQTQSEIRGYQRTAQANALQGVKTEWIGPTRPKARLIATNWAWSWQGTLRFWRKRRVSVCRWNPWHYKRWCQSRLNPAWMWS